MSDRRFTAESLRGNPFASEVDQEPPAPSITISSAVGRRRSSNSVCEMASADPPAVMMRSYSGTGFAPSKSVDWDGDHRSSFTGSIGSPAVDASEPGGPMSRVGSFTHKDPALSSFLQISDIVRQGPDDGNLENDRTLLADEIYEEDEEEDDGQDLDTTSTELAGNLFEAFQTYDTWLRNDIGRPDVEGILAAEPTGSFIIRPSSREGHSVLCLKFESLILHYLIERYA
jgi:hypothetical protein